ncbi:MAG: hypothetical protein HY430_00395 [Candidatus Levybacteria bacterium]|nr:hypothetical protein [Candidatus Levybacteria bacterium]
MKKVLLLFGLLLPFLFLLPYGFGSLKQKIQHDFSQVVPTHIPSPTPTWQPVRQTREKQSIFIPYWAVKKDDVFQLYDRLLYFGITSDDDGVSKNEAGYQNLAAFSRIAPQESEKILTFRMTDTQTNFSLLDNEVLKKRVIEQTISLAKQYNFSGIALDLEVNALPFDSVVKQINTFVKDFSSAAKKDDLSVVLILYGDIFYRVRPIEVKTVASYADEVMIMAYDLHKIRGEPGPNFPLTGKQAWGYDLQAMLDDYLRFIPPEKMSIIFGMYGYDWEVDEKGKTIGNGSIMTVNKAEKTFSPTCSLSDCSIIRDPSAHESKITYTDQDGTRHIVWYEDEKSAEQKKAYLRNRGIQSFSYWAYSYF